MRVCCKSTRSSLFLLCGSNLPNMFWHPSIPNWGPSHDSKWLKWLSIPFKGQLEVALYCLGHYGNGALIEESLQRSWSLTLQIVAWRQLSSWEMSLYGGLFQQKRGGETVDWERARIWRQWFERGLGNVWWDNCCPVSEAWAKWQCLLFSTGKIWADIQVCIAVGNIYCNISL